MNAVFVGESSEGYLREHMRKQLRSILFGVVATLAPFASSQAQEIVMVNGVEATRVVIGPAVSPLAKVIKAGLKDQFYSAKAGTKAWQNAQGLYYFYGARNFEPIWLEGEGDSVKFSQNALSILDVFEDATMEGLPPFRLLAPSA